MFVKCQIVCTTHVSGITFIRFNRKQMIHLSHSKTRNYIVTNTKQQLNATLNERSFINSCIYPLIPNQSNPTPYNNFKNRFHDLLALNIRNQINEFKIIL